MYTNLKTLISSYHRLLSYLVLVILALAIWWYSTDIVIMFGNYGSIHTYTDIVLSMIMILIFPLFLVALGYKSYKYGKRADIGRKTGSGILGGIIGTIISGASCCGATLAASF
jgi:membrane protein implicated in regulation of membrane protease activity